MTKNILNWAEKQGMLDSTTPQLHMLHVQREVGSLAMASIYNEPDKVSQSIAEVVINLTIVAELFGLNIDDCVRTGFYKGREEVNDAQLIAALQDSNHHYIKQLHSLQERLDRLDVENTQLRARTVIMMHESDQK